MTFISYLLSLVDGLSENKDLSENDHSHDNLQIIVVDKFQTAENVPLTVASTVGSTVGSVVIDPIKNEETLRTFFLVFQNEFVKQGKYKKCLKELLDILLFIKKNCVSNETLEAMYSEFQDSFLRALFSELRAKNRGHKTGRFIGIFRIGRINNKQLAMLNISKTTEQIITQLLSEEKYHLPFPMLDDKMLKAILANKLVPQSKSNHYFEEIKVCLMKSKDPKYGIAWAILNCLIDKPFLKFPETDNHADLNAYGNSLKILCDNEDKSVIQQNFQFLMLAAIAFDKTLITKK